MKKLNKVAMLFASAALAAPSQKGCAVAGVQLALRQQYSLVPLRHCSVPSPLRQFADPLAACNSAAVGTRGAAPMCAAAVAAIGAARAADAKSIATLFSFFIESPLEEGRRGGAKRPNRKRENLANTRFDERSPPINSLCQSFFGRPHFGRDAQGRKPQCCAGATGSDE